MPLILWTQYFLEAQGYEVRENTVFQDNQSAILLEKNGKCSSSRRMRHINIRYFFVMDHIQSKKVVVEYCPTDEMLADMFTKLLQGVAFRHFRSAVLNLPNTDKFCPTTVPVPGHRSVLENEPTTKRITSGNGQTSESIKLEGSRRVSNVALMTERMAENSVGKQRVS